jgi:short-subunit dehydrogenase involved in D-alanine esterification of teichoic acids
MLLFVSQAVCSANPGMKHVTVDVSDPRSVQEAWGRVVEMFPDIDCIVNYAGVMQPLNFNIDGARIVALRSCPANLFSPCFASTLLHPDLLYFALFLAAVAR